jgi:hypothetical protein
MLGEALGVSQKSDFFGQVGRIARPSLGQGATTQHGDPGGAIDGGHLADARRGARGVPVLDVVAETAVVDDVVELDGAVVGGRRHKVLDDGRGVERRRRAVGQEIQERCGVARPRRLLDVADGPVGDRQDVVGFSGIDGGLPQL